MTDYGRIHFQRFTLLYIFVQKYILKFEFLDFFIGSTETWWRGFDISIENEILWKTYEIIEKICRMIHSIEDLIFIQ